MPRPRFDLADRLEHQAGNVENDGHLNAARYMREAAAALRRLASSDSGVKGEPEPVAWQWRCCIGGNWGAWLELDQPVEQFRSGRWAFNLKNGTAELRALYTAPPADAGMREALERIQSAYDELCVRFSGVHSDDAMDSVLLRLHAALKALTAPGATTKSDGASRPCTCHPDDKPPEPCPQKFAYTECVEATKPSDPSSTRSGRWVCAARQLGITLDPQDCDWPVCGCDPLANKVLDTIAESGFVIVPKDGAPMTDDQIKHMVDRFLMWQLPENFNPDAGISYTRPNWPESWPGPVGTNLFDAVQATAMVRHMLDSLPSSTRSEVTVESLHQQIFMRVHDALDGLVTPIRLANEVWTGTRDAARALLDQFEIRRK